MNDINNFFIKTYVYHKEKFKLVISPPTQENGEVIAIPPKLDIKKAS